VYLKEPDKDIEIALTFGLPIRYARAKKTRSLFKSPACQFTFDRYKRGESKGQRRLEQQCLGIESQTLMVQKTYGATGKRPDFEPLTSIPQEVRDQVPFIHIGIDRSLAEQLPRSSLLAPAAHVRGH